MKSASPTTKKDAAVPAKQGPQKHTRINPCGSPGADLSSHNRGVQSIWSPLAAVYPNHECLAVESYSRAPIDEGACTIRIRTVRYADTVIAARAGTLPRSASTGVIAHSVKGGDGQRWHSRKLGPSCKGLVAAAATPFEASQRELFSTAGAPSISCTVPAFPAQGPANEVSAQSRQRIPTGLGCLRTTSGGRAVPYEELAIPAAAAAALGQGF